MLNLCATTFKYKEVQTSETKATAVPSKPDSSKAKARLEEAILAKGAAREMMARHRESRYLLGKTSVYKLSKALCTANSMKVVPKQREKANTSAVGVAINTN